jgi:hypothetical protein
MTMHTTRPDFTPPGEIERALWRRYWRDYARRNAESNQASARTRRANRGQSTSLREVRTPQLQREALTP